MTWEPAAKLPRSLINEFEAATKCVPDVLTDTSFGLINQTVIVVKQDATSSPSYSLPSSDPGLMHTYVLHWVYHVYLQVCIHYYTYVY